METNTSPHCEVVNLFQRKEKKVRISDKTYLAGPGFIGIRKEVLYSCVFKRARMENGRAVHLDFHRRFIVKDKPLEIDVEYFLSYGPLGDRLRARARYDGREIGAFKGLHSYMGGGSQGEWPAIREADWQLVIDLIPHSGTSGYLRFAVEYYERLEEVAAKPTPIPKSTVFTDPALRARVLRDRYRLEDLNAQRETCWEIPVDIGNDGKGSGTLSCCRYPGYQRYYIWQLGTFTPEEYLNSEKPFISEAGPGECLYTLEYLSGEQVERHMPWDFVMICHRKREETADKTIL